MKVTCKHGDDDEFFLEAVGTKAIYHITLDAPCTVTTFMTTGEKPTQKTFESPSVALEDIRGNEDESGTSSATEL